MANHNITKLEIGMICIPYANTMRPEFVDEKYIFLGIEEDPALINKMKEDGFDPEICDCYNFYSIKLNSKQGWYYSFEEYLCKRFKTIIWNNG